MNRPFNLEEAKAGHPLITRDGRPAKFVAHVPEAKDSQHVIVMIDRTVVAMYGYGGTCPHATLREQHDSDLFMAPRTIVKWGAVSGLSQDAAMICRLSLYGNEDEARRRSPGCIVARIEWEE